MPFSVDPAVVGVMIPIVALLMGGGLAMLALYLSFRRKSEALRLYHAQRMAAIEKGIELPPPPPEDQLVDRVERGRRSYFVKRLSGLVLIFVGLTVTVAMWQSGAGGASWWGMMPAAVGAALLVSAIMDARDEERAKPPRDWGNIQPPDL